MVLHGHFYQPPREDPWLDTVEREPSAAPFHDWNQRIEQECYRAVVAARRYGADGRIAAIVNTLASISFDFGPTLLDWLEQQAPDTYDAILAADRESVERNDGHGNAIAMPYHHLILPLASRRDKVTEVRWGIADFRRRFRREPEGFWLPETAVDDETLDVLAAEGIRFTVLAPHQVEVAPPGGLPARYRTSGGRDIALFVYDGAISHDIAFGGLLNDARVWTDRMVAPEKSGARRPLVSVATDGESYGHHHRFGEVALASMLHMLETRADTRVENYGAVLARHPSTMEARLVAPSSWSCVHGVERWRSDCACRMAPPATSRPMHWRAPLRQALDWLAAELHALYQREGDTLFRDPWGARDAYGAARRDAAAVAHIVAGQLRHPDAAAGQVRARALLEIEWDALSMFTSCGWFFDDVSGIETLQILRYAAHAIDLVGGDAARLEAGLLERLAGAESAVAVVGTGRDLYLARVKPKVPGTEGRSLAARALVRAVRSLASDQSAAAITAVLDLADLLAQEGLQIPFDAQTAFGRVRATVTPRVAQSLAPVATRLGFTQEG